MGPFWFTREERGNGLSLPLKGGGGFPETPSPLKGEGWEGGGSQRSCIN
jgi:hypothetical protein